MGKYNIFQAVFLSFFSADFYRAVAQRWRGIGFWYLLLLVLVTTLPGAILFWLAMANVDRAMLAPVTKKIPRIEIRHGEAFVTARQPIHITIPDYPRAIIIIDTHDNPVHLDKYEIAVVLRRLTVTIKQPGQLQDIKLRDLAIFLGDPVVIDQPWVEDTILWWRDCLTIAFVPFVVVFSFCFRFVQLLIYGLIGVLMGSSRNPPLTYAQGLRLSAMAMTPVFVINCIFELAVSDERAMCFWWLVSLVLPVFWLSFGIRSAYQSPPPTDTLERDRLSDEDDEFYERRRDQHS